MPSSSLHSEYQLATDWLFQQFPSYQQLGAKAYKPTLENTLKLLAHFDNPQDRLRFVHVAGSNGKGSVTSMLASILTEAEYTVGLFTSPHISDYRERIRINGQMIDEATVVEFIRNIRETHFDFSPSFFEVTFALSLAHFAQKQCDICVIETGLGGRLDSTNVISPLLTVITTISLEHTAILGNTIEAIAREKGGIIKKETPVVLGQLPGTAQQIMHSIALENNSTVYNSHKESPEPFKIPLLGNHQQANFNTVKTCCDVLRENEFSISNAQIQKGLNHLNQNTGFTGRLQVISHDPLLIYDVSHNAEGIAASIEYVNSITTGELHIIYGTSNDKDVSAILPIFPSNALFYFSEFSNPRSMKTKAFEQLAKDQKLLQSAFFQAPTKALESARNAADQKDTILVIGSFFLISDFF